MSLVLNLVGCDSLVVFSDSRTTVTKDGVARRVDATSKSFRGDGFIVSTAGEATTATGVSVGEWLRDLAKDHMDPTSFPLKVLNASSVDARLTSNGAVIFVAFYSDGIPRVYHIDTKSQEVKLRLSVPGGVWNGDHLAVVDSMIEKGIEWRSLSTYGLVDLGSSVMDAVATVAKYKASQSVNDDYDIRVLHRNGAMYDRRVSAASAFYDEERVAVEQAALLRDSTADAVESNDKDEEEASDHEDH